MEKFKKISKNWEIGIYKHNNWTFIGLLEGAGFGRSFGFEVHNRRFAIVFPRPGFKKLRRFLRIFKHNAKHPIIKIKTFFKQLFCKHDIQHYRGYPGEHIYGCKKCGKVVGYDFNINEVI